MGCSYGGDLVRAWVLEWLFLAWVTLSVRPRVEFFHTIAQDYVQRRAGGRIAPHVAIRVVETLALLWGTIPFYSLLSECNLMTHLGSSLL